MLIARRTFGSMSAGTTGSLSKRKIPLLELSRKKWKISKEIWESLEKKQERKKTKGPKKKK